MSDNFIKDLWDIIEKRQNADSDHSWTAKLLQSDKEKIIQKFGEESVEIIIAAMANDKEEIIKESADVIYHLCVLWAKLGLTPQDIADELVKRQQQSGIEEKKKRH